MLEKSYHSPASEVIIILPMRELCTSPGGDTTSSGQAGGFIHDGDVEEGGSF